MDVTYASQRLPPRRCQRYGLQFICPLSVCGRLPAFRHTDVRSPRGCRRKCALGWLACAGRAVSLPVLQIWRHYPSAIENGRLRLACSFRIALHCMSQLRAETICISTSSMALLSAIACRERRRPLPLPHRRNSPANVRLARSTLEAWSGYVVMNSACQAAGYKHSHLRVG